jgi:CRISPR-associated protein Cas2
MINANKGKPIVVAYDISKNKTRRRIFNILKEWKLEGQKSVAECRLRMREAEELFLQLSEPLNRETDCLMMAWLEPRRNILCRGIGTSAIDKNLLRIG